MAFRRIIGYWSAVILVSLADPCMATHVRSIEIHVNRDPCTSLTVEIVIIAYVNYAGTDVKFGGEDSIVRFGDGTEQLIPETDHVIYDPERFIGKVEIKISHTYTGYGRYTVSFSEPNRNFGILNFDQSINTPFYTETSILLEPGVCNTSPRFLVAPVDEACSGVSFYHNAAAFDQEDDSLSYELVVPKKNANTPVTNYVAPESEKFYTGISYNEANENKNGRPTFRINPIDGMITWDAAGNTGEYGVAIKVTEWKYNVNDGLWYEVGHVIRDMQIMVVECDNQKPQLDSPRDFCVIAGSVIEFTIPASDPDHDDVVIEAFSDVFDFPQNAAVVTPANGALQSTRPPYDTALLTFTWQTSCDHIKDQPHRIVLKISDRPSAGPRLVRFYTINIKVIAPAPEYENVVINPVTKKVTLQWKNYACPAVEGFQIWRRIEEISYEQPDCNNGMPNFLRYQLLDKVPSTAFTYTDDDLSFGAQYCYRIVALIGSRNVPSRISEDTCFVPKPAEAPVVVNVSVRATDQREGEIFVRWTHPFDIDQQQYPPPYQYKVFRKTETDDQSRFEPVTTETISDTVFNDKNLNTIEHIYRYQIELYVPSLTTSPLDSSSEASSVFSVTQPVSEGIDLRWSANTPWYNYSHNYPYHLIYRSNAHSGPFVLIDSVDVNENDFHYTDRGQHNGVNLTGGLYYYKIKTRGTYGNAKISSPLENYSQITSGQILDTIPPCKPTLALARIDCEEFSCDGSDYYSKLEWSGPEIGCDEVVEYEVLVQDEGSDVYTSIGRVTQNGFLHKNIKSLNKCYRLIAFDVAGNPSDTSVAVCNSNCVAFKLPNVISPGVEDEQNDFLTTYPEDDSRRGDCARSLRQVDITIFSRWGDEIFSATITDPELPLLWNGLNNEGSEVSTGTYYYHANVLFDTWERAQQNLQIKGWVHVVR